ncbi:MAG: MFS transporter [Nitrospirae bacterium]|nr:MFS transporter [Nitrospirota bacterium]
MGKATSSPNALATVRPLKPFSALTYRNFRLFWIGQVISLTGSWMQSAAQGWLVLKLTDSPFYLGLAGMAGGLPIILFSLAGGVAADRFSKRNMLLLTQVMFTALTLMLAVLVSAKIINVWHVLFFSFLIGMVSAFDIPARQSFLMEMVGKESLLNAIALNSAAFNGARVIGPAIAGFLIGYLDIAVCFYINAVSFIAGIISYLRMRPDEMKTVEPPEAKLSLPGKRLFTDIFQEFKEGIKYIFTEPKIYTLIVFVAITSLFGFPYITFLPVYARDILKTGATGLGVLMGSAGAGAFTGAVGLALKEDFKRKGMLFAAAGITFPVALLLFSYSETPWFSSLMLFLVGWGAISQMATANSMLQITAPDRLRGRVMSAFTLMFLGMAAVGNFIVGSIAHRIGTQNAVATGAVLCLFGIVLLLWKKPEVLKIS